MSINTVIKDCTVDVLVISVAFNYINKNDKLMICVLDLEFGRMLTLEQKNTI